MLVKVKRSIAGEYIRYGAGAIIDLPDDVARYWVENDKATYLDTDVKAVEIVKADEDVKADAVEMAVKPQYKKAVKKRK